MLTKRDTKGRFASNEPQEMSEEQLDAICYKSKLLNRYFDDYDELVKAETEFKEKEAAKEAGLKEKRELAAKIEEAYKNTLSVRREATAKINEADKKYYELRNQFISKYGAYHMTFTNQDDKAVVTVDDWFDKVFASIFR